jgi:ribosomal protein S18 acetylase RimI-like enzyme
MRRAGVGSESDFFVLAPWDAQVVEILKKRLEAGGGGGSFVGIGHSMEPTLLAGDRVRIEVMTGEVKRGWILVFPWEGRILTHRVVGVRDSLFWARGDAGGCVEGPVPVEDAVGRVVAYWRDGKWHSVEGVRARMAGLFVNHVLGGVRRAARRWPRARRVVELNIVGGAVARRMYRKVGRWVYGDVHIKEEESRRLVIGALVSEDLPLTQQLVRDVEDRIARGDLKLLVARSSRVGRIGNVLLIRIDLEGHVPVGYITALVVSFGARGMGIGRLLISAAENAARSCDLKRLVALVAPDNVRSLGAFRAAGYREVPLEELARRPVEERESVPRDKVLLEKGLLQ